MHSTSRRPILLVGAGERAYSAHSLLQIAAAHPLVLVDRTIPAWARPYLADAVTADPAASDKAATAAAAFAVEHSVTGVVTYLPEYTALAADLANRLGLPGNRPTAVVRTQEPSWARAVVVGDHETDPDGRDVAMEAVVVAPGEVRPVAITRMDIRPEVTAGPVGYSVDARDDLLHNRALHNVISQAITALGLTTGVIHADVRVSPSGPRVRRIHACVAEGLIPLLVARATGISLARTAAALAVGDAPDLSPTHERAAALRFLYPETSGPVARLNPAAPTPAEPWFDRFAWTRQTGSSVRGPADSNVEAPLAHWVVTGADAPVCLQRLDLIAERLGAPPPSAWASRAPTACGAAPPVTCHPARPPDGSSQCRRCSRAYA